MKISHWQIQFYQDFFVNTIDVWCELSCHLVFNWKETGWYVFKFCIAACYTPWGLLWVKVVKKSSTIKPATQVQMYRSRQFDGGGHPKTGDTAAFRASLIPGSRTLTQIPASAQLQDHILILISYSVVSLPSKCFFNAILTLHSKSPILHYISLFCLRSHVQNLSHIL